MQACPEACLFREPRASQVDSGHQRNAVRTTVRRLGVWLNGRRLDASTLEALGPISSMTKTSIHGETSLSNTAAISHDVD